MDSQSSGLKILVHASTWFAPVLLPLVVYFLSSDSDVKRISLQALIFHFLIGILIGVSIFFSFILIGIPFLIIFGLMAIISPIKGMIYATQNRHFQYPFLGFIK
ncbi:putative Tic20 family protein [Croceifilum oryzae]|uniref:Tic20 family protein n=1 Tax=Croceifilum oryzae TaxID=1553429 RepID=A0AAJ1TI23_9BACL|nr:DUF4870 domain-containing protein [Croceifilum oryzae]MDQ0417367.1 putative Tic20 family protein [Croceifilum oryzae]